MNGATTVKLGQRALVAGMAGLALCGAGAFFNPEQFFRSYLLGYLFWTGIVLGSFAVIMLHHLTGGGWGMLIRPALEAAIRTAPLLALLFVPLLVGLRELYPWARPELVAADELLQHRSAYLNAPFFIVRSVFYFAVWCALAFWLTRSERPPRWLSAPGLGLIVLTVTFASIDWVMSLDAHWFSTIFGFLFLAGNMLASLAFAVCVVALPRDGAPAVPARKLHDLGNLMLTFVLLWAYIAFSQYLIIWSGNLPEETAWYLDRSGTGWVTIAVILIVFHFAAPSALLLSRRTKRAVRNLGAVAALILFMRLVDLFWHVAPAFHGSEVRVHWMDLAAPVGIGGVWLAVFAWQLRRRPPAAVDHAGGER